MRRPVSGRVFVALVAFFLVAYIAGGFVSGAAGLTELQAMLVMAGLTVIAVPVLILTAPPSLLRRAGFPPR